MQCVNLTQNFALHKLYQSPPRLNLTAKRAYLGAADGEISSRKFNRRADILRDCG
ncbi:hypothetical protein [uncultured Campylobacter sp.]|uniref:hypothetical protein n=1 Tax=uncultured Campylobacter sp. TaxID=218934 RepID=UPI002630017D|nr:hypothetical protein [uncultured Campylobacter sp.]